jgi:hypothetical protein
MQVRATGTKECSKKRIVLTGGELVFLVSANTSASETPPGINQLL